LILLDTSGVFAALDPRDRLQQPAANVVVVARPPLLLSPFVLAELDYLVGRRLGSDDQRSLLHEVARGAFRLEPFSARDVEEARDVIERYADLRIGLADASIVVLARRHGCLDVLTLDERHFRALRGPRDQPFRVLPADARP
jgi:uncharacterized protein